MQVLIKLFITVITTISVFLSNLLCPATIYPESENFDFSFLQYPDEAIITLEEAGLTEQVELDGITANGVNQASPQLFFIIGKYCDIT